MRFAHHHPLRLLVLAALAVPLAAAAAPQYAYTAKALVPFRPAQGSGVATSINNAGVACGTNFRNNYGFCQLHGVLADIAPFPDNIYSEVAAINNAGAIVGSSATGERDIMRAFIYVDGRMTDLGTLDRPIASALGVNDAGHVVGWARVGDYYNVAFLYKDGLMRSLGTMHGAQRSTALGINNKGQIVGLGNIAPDFDPGGNDQHAFLYEHGVINDLGTLGGRNSTANGINDRGEVAGTSDIAPVDSGQQRAFIYTATGGMRDLGTLPNGASTRANAINKRGDVVGVSLGEGGRAFIYQPAVGMRDLTDMLDPASGWLIEYATGINERGQIVGYGCKESLCGPVQLDLVGDDKRDRDRHSADQ